MGNGYLFQYQNVCGALHKFSLNLRSSEQSPVKTGNISIKEMESFRAKVQNKQNYGTWSEAINNFFHFDFLFVALAPM